MENLKMMNRSTDPATIEAVSFQSDLGWMGICVEQNRIVNLAFGYPSRLALESNVDFGVPFVIPTEDHDFWVEPLQDFSAGDNVDFSKWKISTDHLTAFQKRVINLCRKISFGKTLSYGKLAAKAGSPQAARAVGTVMSSNQVPIVVPCHRVIGANGNLGGYSSPRGLEMKRHLLQMEGSL